VSDAELPPEIGETDPVLAPMQGAVLKGFRAAERIRSCLSALELALADHAGAADDLKRAMERYRG
jgi:hypothetical protein